MSSKDKQLGLYPRIPTQKTVNRNETCWNVRTLTLAQVLISVTSGATSRSRPVYKLKVDPPTSPERVGKRVILYFPTLPGSPTLPRTVFVLVALLLVHASLFHP